MVTPILLTGVFTAVTLAIVTWIVSKSILLTMLAYSLAGLIGCFLAGAAVYLCPSRAAPRAAQPLPKHLHSRCGGYTRADVAFGDCVTEPKAKDILLVLVLSRIAAPARRRLEVVSSATTQIDLRVAEEPNPRPGARIAINGAAFLVRGEPVRDCERLVWPVDLRPEW
jgi:hypothetical protein